MGTNHITHNPFTLVYVILDSMIQAYASFYKNFLVKGVVIVSKLQKNKKIV